MTGPGGRGDADARARQTGLLLFWPRGIDRGGRRLHHPLKLIATLSASLVAALIFTPTLGALIGKAP